jgi:hypothetical protein
MLLPAEKTRNPISDWNPLCRDPTANQHMGDPTVFSLCLCLKESKRITTPPRNRFDRLAKASEDRVNCDRWEQIMDHLGDSKDEKQSEGFRPSTRGSKLPLHERLGELSQKRGIHVPLPRGRLKILTFCMHSVLGAIENAKFSGIRGARTIVRGCVPPRRVPLLYSIMTISSKRQPSPFSSLGTLGLSN